jgi:hypothetical protein
VYCRIKSDNDLLREVKFSTEIVVVVVMTQPVIHVWTKQRSFLAASVLKKTYFKVAWKTYLSLLSRLGWHNCWSGRWKFWSSTCATHDGLLHPRYAKVSNQIYGTLSTKTIKAIHFRAVKKLSVFYHMFYSKHKKTEAARARLLAPKTVLFNDNIVWFIIIKRDTLVRKLMSATGGKWN